MTGFVRAVAGVRAIGRSPFALRELGPSLIRGLERTEARLFLTSAILLYAELALIRWIPANVVYVAFFANLVLMASFLGIGIGILLGRRFAPARFPFWAPLLVVTAFFVLAVKIDVRPLLGGSFLSELAERHAADPQYVVLLLIFALVAALMAALAMPLGPLLRAMPPLRAYAIDIAGAIAGITAFSACSAAGAPPPIWFGVLGAALALRGGFRRGPWSRLAFGSVAVVIAVTFVMQSVVGDIWSPYYRITMFSPANDIRFIAVNGIPHQNFYPLTEPRREAFYDQVYRWFPERRFDRVLIIGAGNGTDVAGALARGARSVDAVEIDPRILELGERFHPDRPYADPRVHEIVDDGRAELRRSDRVYDLIVFALTDSLTLSSTAANLRLESFLYTKEAFASARDRLAPDGVLVVYNYYAQPFLVGKLARMLEEVFGSQPLVRTYAGPGNPGAALAAGGDMSRGRLGDVTETVDTARAAPGATDDWPFLYIERPGIAGYYLLVLGGILALCAAAVVAAARAAGAELRRASPHFFVLGTAFLLLETRNIATFSLLFGTTWAVNALVFAAILLSVLAAIGVSARWRVRGPLPYILLGSSLAANYLVSPTSLLIDPPVARYAIASLLAFLPIFFANLVFTASFRETRTADMAFASNVLGAVVGGCLEYAALVTGYQQLVLLIAILYAIAFASTRIRFLGDRDLAFA